MCLGIELVLGRLHWLVVAFENFAFPSNNRHRRNVFFHRFSACNTVSGRSAPKHRSLILNLSCDIGNVGATAPLIEVVDTILQICWVLLFTLWRFVGPEWARPLWAIFIVFMVYLALQEWPHALLSKRSVKFFLGLGQSSVFIGLQCPDFLNLFHPVGLRSWVFKYGIGKFLRQIWGKTRTCQ